MEPGNSRDSYLYGYPGDAYVDLLGIDNYRDVGVVNSDSLKEQGITNLIQSLEMLTDLAFEKNKACALTETGSEGIKDSEWFTNRILNPIKSSVKARRISYILMWRNNDIKHHFMTYPGHATESDFKNFINDPLIKTLKDIGRTPRNSKLTMN